MIIFLKIKRNKPKIYSNLEKCPKNCSNQGKCKNGLCECNKGFKGFNCGKKACFNNCNSKGICQENKECKCQEGILSDYLIR